MSTPSIEEVKRDVISYHGTVSDEPAEDVAGDFEIIKRVGMFVASVGRGTSTAAAWLDAYRRLPPAVSAEGGEKEEEVGRCENCQKRTDDLRVTADDVDLCPECYADLESDLESHSEECECPRCKPTPSLPEQAREADFDCIYVVHGEPRCTNQCAPCMYKQAKPVPTPAIATEGEAKPETFTEFWENFGKRWIDQGDSPESVAQLAWHAALGSVRK